MSEPAQVPGPERPRGAKSAFAFRTISEVADDLDVPPHVLRFWESRFSQVRPLKRGGGRRYYRPEDVDLLRMIRDLLYTDGYTIKGVQKLLREVGVKGARHGAAARAPVGPAASPEPPDVGSGEIETLRVGLEDMLEEIEALAERLRKAIG